MVGTVEAQADLCDEKGYLDLANEPTEVEAEIHPGGKLAAMLYAATANTTHGRRRDREDAIAAATVAIRALWVQDPERRPTVDAVKTTARVGTETAQLAFRELEEQQRLAFRELEEQQRRRMRKRRGSPTPRP